MPNVAEKTTRTVDAMVKREAWINHAIPTPEREKLLDEIKYWVGRCTTVDLIELLPEVARKANNEDVLRDPMVTTELEDGEDPAVTKPGLVIVDDVQPKNQPDAT